MKLFKCSRRLCKRHIYKSGPVSFRIAKDRVHGGYCIKYVLKYEKGIWRKQSDTVYPSLMAAYRDLLQCIDCYKDKSLDPFQKL